MLDRAGEELTDTYTDLWGSLVHRRQDISNWFFECGCERCSDPYCTVLYCTVYCTGAATPRTSAPTWTRGGAGRRGAGAC